jgi:hypothetical protein
MSNEAAWLLLSFAILVVATLATLYEKVDRLEKRLDRLEGAERGADEGASLAEPTPATYLERAGRPRDHRARR